MKMLVFLSCATVVAWAGKMNDELYVKRWKLTPPMEEEKWSRFLGTKALDQYTVKPGDTLAKISQNLFGTIEYWPKLWEVNKDRLTNPHLLEPNQKLLFVRPSEQARQPAQETRSKSISQKSPKNREPADLPDQLLNGELAHEHRLRLIFSENIEILGIITGSFDDKATMSSDNRVYVGPLKKEKFTPGKKLAVIREVKVPSKIQQKIPSGAGPLVEVIGELEVEAQGLEYVRAHVKASYDRLERGDRVIELESFKLGGPMETPPSTLATEILFGENFDQISFIQGQTVVLNKGAHAGMKVGHHFQIFEDIDPVFKESNLVDPRAKGEVRVVYVTPYTSVGYILNCKTSVEVGDALVAATQLPEEKLEFQRNRKPFLLE